jgi:hypothetical protein
VSEIAKKTKDGWRVVTGLWSEGTNNKEANDAAKAKKVWPIDPLPAGGDPTLLDAFQKLTTSGLDDAATKRKDLVVFGSAPKERTTSGAAFAKAWRAAWVNKTKVDSIRASNEANATLGYVIANITLSKKDYAIPFRVLCVFERKTTSEPWSLVHAHFAVARLK